MKLQESVPLLVASLLTLAGCGASQPSSIEADIANEVKEVTIGGEDWEDPTPDTKESIEAGAEHFRHHCQVCHGLDGHATGVPFAGTMSPPVPDLGSSEIQDYTDGQLKWIIENGIRFTGMPGWQGVIDDEHMWLMVRYIRNLPSVGSLGPPAVYVESDHNSGAEGDHHDHSSATEEDGGHHEH
ncbi:MAG: c-type cytochrome [Acidobacteria bacterium]|nr:c-type cytochrome [Acidobacteriota bacterium]